MKARQSPLALGRDGLGPGGEGRFGLGEVAARCLHMGVFRRQMFLPNRQGAAMMGDGRREILLLMRQGAEVVKITSDTGVLGAVVRLIYS